MHRLRDRPTTAMPIAHLSHNIAKRNRDYCRQLIGEPHYLAFGFLGRSLIPIWDEYFQLLNLMLTFYF